MGGCLQNEFCSNVKPKPPMKTGSSMKTFWSTVSMSWKPKLMNVNMPMIRTIGVRPTMRGATVSRI